MSKMPNMVKSNPEELVKAFRRVAKKLGCDKSEQRFQEVLFAIGTQKGGAHKPAGQLSKRGSNAHFGGHAAVAKQPELWRKGG
jgi:hypothetical protein